MSADEQNHSLLLGTLTLTASGLAARFAGFFTGSICPESSPRRPWGFISLSILFTVSVFPCAALPFRLHSPGS